MSEPERDTANDAAAMMVCEEARRLLVRQEANLDTLRARAVAILSVGSLAAGLFGSRVNTAHASAASTSLIVAALASFGFAALLVVIVLWPRDWKFEHGLSDPLERLRSGVRVPVLDVGTSWATGYESDREANRNQLESLMCVFLWACTFTALSVVLWGVALVLSR